MNTSPSVAQPLLGSAVDESPEAPSGLTIGSLARSSGLSVPTLRMWEARHGFPRPRRLVSGHRRYSESDVDLVAQVVALRASGLRLDVAIAQVLAVVDTTAATPVAPTSLHAHLRRLHPGAPMHRLRKSTLIGLSWAIEDEFCAKAEAAHLFGAFERSGNYVSAAPRWAALARVAASAHVFADFADGSPVAGEPGPAPWRVALGVDHPMRSEWAVVCDSVELPVALTAWEVPGQDHVAEGDRLFESVWTIDPVAVRDAARLCASVALDAGSPTAAATLRDLERPVASETVDLLTVTRLVGRIVAYVDEATGPPRPGRRSR